MIRLDMVVAAYQSREGDVSWRLCATGWHLHYLPHCKVIHRTHEVPGWTRHVAACGVVRIAIPYPRNWLRRPSVFSWLRARRQFLRGIARWLGIG